MDSVAEFFDKNIRRGYTEEELAGSLKKKGFSEERIKEGLEEFRKTGHKPYRNENTYHFIELGVVLFVTVSFLLQNFFADILPAHLMRGFYQALVFFVGMLLQVVICLILYVHHSQRKLFAAPLTILLASAIYLFLPALTFIPGFIRGVMILIVLIAAGIFTIIYSIRQVHENLMADHLQETHDPVEWFRSAVFNIFIYYIPLTALCAALLRISAFALIAFIYSIPIFYLVARKLDAHHSRPFSTLRTAAYFGFLVGISAWIVAMFFGDGYGAMSSPVWILAPVCMIICSMIIVSFLRFHIFHHKKDIPPRDYPTAL